MPGGDLFDAHDKRLNDVRYADETLIGVIGSKADAQRIMAHVRAFLQEQLHLKIAEEKARVVHASAGTLVLGYESKTRTTDRQRQDRRADQHHTTVRTGTRKITLHIPAATLLQCCHRHTYANDQTTHTVSRPAWLQRSDAEIILASNAALRGLANYDSLASGAKHRMHKLQFGWRGSLLKPLAHQHRTTVTSMATRLKRGGIASFMPRSSRAKRGT